MPTQPSDFYLSPDTTTQHMIDTPFGELRVWVRELTWIQRQNALTQFVSFKANGDGDPTPSIDFGGYWSYMLTNCIERTEPSLTKEQLLNVRPEVGDELAKILPSFDSLVSSLSASGPLG